MGPLAGIKILDLSRILAGPWATQCLADFGATVWKIEKPGSGDDTRHWGPPWVKTGKGKDRAEAASFGSTNRGKRSLAIDFTKAAGQQIIRSLAMRADVYRLLPAARIEEGVGNGVELGHGVLETASLLVLLGQRGLGPIIEQTFGFRFVFAWPGAVVAASITALPLVLTTVQISFADISREIEDAARVDGCSEWQLFLRVMLPIAWRGILAGWLLGFLRALGEFGATLMVAGNIPGRTQTLPMAIYDAVQANDLAKANSMALLLIGLAVVLLFLVLRLNRRITGGIG